MKRLAARDWEDLLQVCQEPLPLKLKLELTCSSVPSRSLKDFYPFQRTITLYGSCCLSWRHGMVWQNFGNIQKLQSVISRIQQLGWVTWCEHFKKKCAFIIKPLTCPVRKQPEPEEKPKQKQWQPMWLRRERFKRGKSQRLGPERSGNLISTLGGYPKAIRLFGSPDNYNSQTGELEHQRGKRHFKTVRKGKHILGIGLQVRRERLIHRLRERNKQNQATVDPNNDLPTVSFEEQSEALPPTPPTSHHHISIDSRQKVQLSQWLHNNRDDPAILVSVSGCTTLFSKLYFNF